eukprot:gb/GECG01007992.1/.p1 GENE.gb/GECG01007992.1/~~gb/GECG01007992.1/.p1  ORF type:complete len:278 (+),score=34.44 gb/GECG01007992.1/:1-834(+)
MQGLHAFLLGVLLVAASFAEAIEGLNKCHMCLFQPQCLELSPEDAENGLVSRNMGFGAIQYLDDVCSCASNLDACLKENSCGYESQLNDLKRDLGCGKGHSPNYMCLLCTYQAFQDKCQGLLPPENMNLNSTSDMLAFAKQVFNKQGKKMCSCIRSIDDCRKQSCSFETPKDLDSFLGRAGCPSSNNDDDEEGTQASKTNEDSGSVTTDDVVTPVIVVVVVLSIVGGIVLQVWFRRRGGSNPPRDISESRRSRDVSRQSRDATASQDADNISFEATI